jgi:hypothetical protein
MPELQERLDSLIADVVVPTLKPRGYRKRRLEWVRATDAAVHAITLQRSHGNAPDHLRLYVDVSAYVPEFARTIGQTVPADARTATPHYSRRFEDVCEWPAQWIDLEAWSDEDLHPAFHAALATLDEHLAGVVTPAALVDVLRAGDAGLDLDLFAWWCATGDRAGMEEQLATARSAFGAEERWPRLEAQFVRVADRYGVALG